MGERLLSSFCSLILDSLVSLWVDFWSAGDFVSQTSQLRILLSAEEENLSHFDSKIAYLSQSFKVSNKHVNRQSQVWKPTGTEVNWAECSLIMGKRLSSSFCSLILDSLVSLWVAFSLQAIWCLRLPSFESCIQQRKTTCLISIKKSLTCANKHVHYQSGKPTGSEVKWAECSIIMGTGYRVQVS